MSTKPMPLMTEHNRGLIWAGLKTMTRRVCKQPLLLPTAISVKLGYDEPSGHWFLSDQNGYTYDLGKSRLQAGDEVYLREPVQIQKIGWARGLIEGVYLDDAEWFNVELLKKEWGRLVARKNPYAKTSPLFMYKSLSRTWRKVTRVWVEQLQDISREDAVAEGIIHEVCHHGHKSVCTAGCRPEPEYKFRTLWNSINEKPRPSIINGVIIGYESYPWDDTGKYAKMETYRGLPHVCYFNPYVFCYEFSEIDK